MTVGSGSLTVWYGLGLVGMGWLALLWRSARRQGETRQFLTSLAVVALLLGGMAGIIALTIWLDRR